MIELAITSGYKSDRESLTDDEQYQIELLEAAIRRERVTPNTKPHKVERAKMDLWSYRVSDDIRLILFKWKPQEWILVACGHHDPVYRKAEQLTLKHIDGEKMPKIVVEEEKRIVIRPVVQPRPEPKTKPAEPGFAGFSEKDFSELGVPAEDVRSLSNIRSTDQLLVWLDQRKSIPQDVKDRLMDLYSAPDRLEEMKRERNAQQSRPALAKALRDSPVASEQFVILSDELRDRFYNGKLENWQVFLHPSQKRSVEMNAAGPMMVTGSAGTGKTVVAVHRVKWLLSNVFTNGEKILFTTFTKTLAKNARTWLDAICSPDMRQRIDVRNLDEFVRKLMEVHLKGKHIDYSETPSSFEIQLPLGGKWDEKFIYREFQDIILEYRIGSLEEYKSFQRPARFGRLAGSEREMLWPVFDEMKKAISSPTCARIPKAHALNQLAAYFKTELGQECREYASIVVDESQDFGASEYRFFAAYTNNTFETPISNSLFLAGDGYQRIYGRSGTFRASSINVVNRSIRLKKCYRSTKKIREFAERLIADVDAKNMDGEVSSIHDGESLLDGVPVEERYFPGDFHAMHDTIAKVISKWKETGSKNLGDYAVLLPRGKTFTKNGRPMDVLSRTAIELSNRGIPTKPFNGSSDDRPVDTVNVMTMHSAKGLQFHGVVVCLNNWPLGTDRDADPAQKKAILDESRCLLYVAIMRASYRVLLTATKTRPRELPAPER